MKVSLSALAIFTYSFLMASVIPLTSHAATKVNVSANYLTQGLVLWQTLDGKTVSSGTVIDQSGQGHTGNLVGTSPTLGKVGQAFNFDGVSDRVYFSTVPSASVFTVSMWIKRQTPINTDGYEDLYASDRGFFIAGGVLNWWDGSDLINGGTSITNGVWHMVSITSDGTNLTVYLDGASDGTVVTGANLPTNAGVGIGGHTYAGEFFHGAMDDVRVYNRALSPAEIKNLYTMGRTGLTAGVSQVGPINLNSGLVDLWTFDGKTVSGTSVTDIGSSPVTATVQGTTQLAIGKVGQGFGFNGSNYLAADSAAANVATGNYTVSAWIKLNSAYANGSGVMAIYRIGDGPSDNDVNFSLGSHQIGGSTLTDGALHLDYYTGGGWASTVSSITSWLPNKWYLVTGTYSATAGTVVYINGVASGSAGVNGRGGSAATHFNIGSCTSSTGCSGTVDVFTGTIDDARVYNRALSAAEVRQLYVAGGGALGTSVSAPASANQNILARWTLDGATISGTSVTDTSGNSHTGTAVGGPTSIIGKIGQGLSFNGSSQYIDTANFADNLADFTISTWFKTTYTGSVRLLVSKLGAGGWATGAGWGLGIVTGGKISALAQTNGSNYAQVTSQSHSDGIWHHAVMTISGGNTAKLYIDGVEDDTTGPNGSGTVAGYSTASNVRIGTDYDGEYFPGSLDDVQIFNKALSATEVAQLYSIGR